LLTYMNRNRRHRIRLKRKVRRAIVIMFCTLIVLTILGAATYHAATAAKRYSVTDASGEIKKLTIEELKETLDVLTFYPGISINGIDMSGKTKEEAAAVFACDPTSDIPEINIVLDVDGVKYPLDFSAFQISSNLTEVINEAYNYGRSNGQEDAATELTARYEIVSCLQRDAVDFRSQYSIDGTEIESALHELLDPLEIPAVDASATSFDTDLLTFKIEESSPGRDIDIEAAIVDVQSAVAANEFAKIIPVNSSVVNPKVSKEDLVSNLGLVSSCTTQTTDAANRNTNISRVCKTLDGLVLQSGESFNFNDFIGKRTAEKGYKEAGGIFDGALRLELGGGICQANGTLFHSVMKADLQVDERHPHSWPSTYVDIGTDATVTWDGPNFQFTNNTGYPIAIHAYYCDHEVTVQIYGRPVADGMKIQIEGVVLSSTPPGPTEYVADPLTPVGQNTTIRSPHNEIKAECYKVYYKNGAESKRVLAFTSSYRAIAEKISVGVLAPDGTICTMDPHTGAVQQAQSPG